PTSRTQRARFSQGGRNTESERSRASARWGSRPESLWDIAMARVLRVQPLEVAGVRDQFNRFVERHGVAWELAMALLAIVYVAVGFALDDPALQPMASTLETAELILTVVFLIEFTSRLGAATNRMTYLRRHWISVIALTPAARTLRILRLLRLLRLIRTFAGVYRALGHVGSLANHRSLQTIVLFWLAVLILR